jgi:iron uptake system EfeUOB component EfeO/EfeM
MVVTISRADRQAARRATATFRVETDSATASFLADVERLRTDLDTGSVAEAETDDLAAQAEFDRFRQLEEGSTDSVVAASIDGTTGTSGPGQSLGGLRSIERDLWTPVGSPDQAVIEATAVAPSVVAQASVARYLLARTSLPPEAIGTTGVDDLDWVLRVALPGQAEPFSHRDAVDIVATVDAADQAFGAIEPVAHRLDPHATAVTAARFTALVATLGPLETPGALPEADLPTATQRLLSARINGTASALAGLASELAPFGIPPPTS